MKDGDPLELGGIAREIQGIADELQARREARRSVAFYGVAYDLRRCDGAASYGYSPCLSR
jgi:hypothetical protein